MFFSSGESSTKTKSGSPPRVNEFAALATSPPPPPPISSTQPSPALPKPTPPLSSSTPYPLIRELILVSLVITPIILLPYLPLRRRLSRLSQNVHELTKQHDITLRQSILQQDRDSVVVKQLKVDLGKYKAEVLKEVQGVKEKSEGEVRLMKVEVTRLAKEVRKVAEAVENEQGYARISPRTLEEIASSFVDIAAFIEEMETMEGLERRGLDPRGIDKMRRLAMNLHAVAQAAVEVRENH